jgi:hypothetical protein
VSLNSLIRRFYYIVLLQTDWKMLEIDEPSYTVTLEGFLQSWVCENHRIVASFVVTHKSALSAKTRCYSRFIE